ncbi:hypothetical protein DESUT3_23430 [Desulfuromonas versatilis]|uniref:SGNH hydrolase-type esterase domain-containing protein n=1 Tax=Desulfuromonas versatilis TaxID=2802975 RepID=A0ABN6E0D4_9BACT|nr:GDSL-type esterase/lipase family protein [Desulfuromonas versatilis]BCR05274.1 hypothetical protein DESUT3_23430 [Desulfuromonas versatilis]
MIQKNFKPINVLVLGGWVLAAVVSIRPMLWRPIPGSQLYSADRISQFSVLGEVKPGGIVLLGDSHIDRGEWSELLEVCNVYNRGIGGNTVGGVLDRLSEAIYGKPAVAILMVGFNDLAKGLDPTSIADNYEALVTDIPKVAKDSLIVINAVFPVNSSIYRGDVNNQKIALLNSKLKELAARHSAIFLNITPQLVDEDGNLSANYTNDGIHLNGSGYIQWAHAIKDLLKQKE